MSENFDTSPGKSFVLPEDVVREIMFNAPRYRDGGVARERHCIQQAAALGYNDGFLDGMQFGTEAERDACCAWLESQNLPELASALQAYRLPPAKYVADELKKIVEEDGVHVIDGEHMKMIPLDLIKLALEVLKGLK